MAKIKDKGARSQVIPRLEDETLTGVDPISKMNNWHKKGTSPYKKDYEVLRKIVVGLGSLGRS